MGKKDSRKDQFVKEWGFNHQGEKKNGERGGRKSMLQEVQWEKVRPTNFSIQNQKGGGGGSEKIAEKKGQDPDQSVEGETKHAHPKKKKQEDGGQLEPWPK